MGVVSFRVSDEDEERLKAAGLVPSALAKAVVEKEARRLSVQEMFAVFEKYRTKPSQPVTAALRDGRGL